MLSVGEGAQWVTGDYDSKAETFTNLSTQVIESLSLATHLTHSFDKGACSLGQVLLADHGGGLGWATVGHDSDGRVLQVCLAVAVCARARVCVCVCVLPLLSLSVRV